MALQTTWFILITVVWSGFFVLEGFDFGVGMLVPVLGRDDVERRLLRATIGPFWDGNEVWLLVAGGAMFAAFPDWYATMFSAYYLPLFAVVVALILRAVASEYRDKAMTATGRRTWDWLMAAGCLLAPLLIGVAFGGLLGGLPIDSQKEFTGTFTDLVQPYALFTGLTFAALCKLQGLAFLRIRTSGQIEARASTVIRPVGVAVVGLLVVFMFWTQAVSGSGVIPNAGAWLALTFAVATAWLGFEPAHRGWAFACSSLTIACTVFGFFGELYPNLMVSTTAAANTLTISNSSSGSYTLTLITIITLVMLPVVLLYTAWNYWVFRRRLDPPDPEDPGDPGEAALIQPDVSDASRP